MSTITYDGTLDVARTPAVPLSRLIKVELRKMVDTRAGLWLCISIGLISALVVVIQLLVASSKGTSLTYTSFLTGLAIPMSILLPVLGVMSVTQEWGQRTGLVTFTLEPRRTRIVTAKLVSGVVMGIGSVVVALALAAVANVLYGAFSSGPAVWNAGIGVILGFVAVQVISVITGFVLGMVILNTAGAVVVYFVYRFVLPNLFFWGDATMEWFHKARPWFDFSSAQGPLTDGSLTSTEWAHLLVSMVIWFVLPLVFGVWRLLRVEVK